MKLNKIAKVTKSRYVFLVSLLALSLVRWVPVMEPTQFAGRCCHHRYWMFDGDGNLYLTEDSQVVATDSINGNSLLICKGNNVPNSTGQVINYDAENNPFAPPAIACTDGVGNATLDWQKVITSRGEAILHCHFSI